MNTDIILYIFQLCDSHTKIPLSLINAETYNKTRFYIQSTECAINTGDVFSIVSYKNWHESVNSYQLGLIGSKFLITRYQKYQVLCVNTCFIGACRSGDINIVKYLAVHNPEDLNYGLYVACKSGHIDTVKYLVELGAFTWNIGLMGACHSGNINIVKYLVKLGVNDDWNYILYEACKSGHIDIVKYMIEQGATECQCQKPISEH